MAKEFTVEKAFRPKDEQGELKTFKAHDKTMWPWMVKVEGENFWFSKNTLENNEIVPGDTMYGLFDEEEYTNGQGEKKTKKVFVKQERKDGSQDVHNARKTAQSDGQLPTPTQVNNQNFTRIEYAISLLELMYPVVTGQELPSKAAEDTKEDEGEDEPINIDDLNL